MENKLKHTYGESENDGKYIFSINAPLDQFSIYGHEQN